MVEKGPIWSDEGCGNEDIDVHYKFNGWRKYIVAASAPICTRVEKTDCQLIKYLSEKVIVILTQVP